MPPISFIRPAAASLSLVNASASIIGSDDTDADWDGSLGFDFAPESCGGGWIENPCSVVARTIPDRPERRRVQAFDVVVGDRCSTFGFSANDYEQRARDALARCESSLISAELWEGTLAQAEGWSNQWLANPDADTVTTGPTAVVDVLACLEQALAECGCGAQGMIHATRQLVTHWSILGGVRREGGRLLTIHDTIVVSDAGYTGSGPYGQTNNTWAYATGLVGVLRSPISVAPDSVTAIGSRVNDVEFYASRAAAYAWDGCCHFAAEADLAPCAIGGSS